MRVRYIYLYQKRYNPRRARSSASASGGHGGPFRHIAGWKSPSILDFERQYLMEPDGLRHGKVLTAVASSQAGQPRQW